MAVRKRHNWWYVDLRHERRRYIKKSPENSRHGAQAYELVLRNRLARGEPIIPANTNDDEATPTFAEFAKEWFETYVKANNKPSEQYSKSIVLRAHLLPYFGSRKLNTIASWDVEQYKSKKLAEHLAAKTVNNHIAVLRKCLNCAAEWDRIDAVPRMRLLKTVSQRLDFLNDEEIARLLRTGSHSSMWDCMVATALHTGMRRGELFALEWSDIDFWNHLVAVRRSMVRGIVTDTKTHRIRYIPLTGSLEQLLQRRRKSSGPIFRREGNALPTPRSADRAIERACRAAGIRQVGWHVLRHTFASQLVRRGVPLRNVQLLLGHSSVTMTERYAHLNPLHLRDAIRVLEEPQERPSVGTIWEPTLVMASNSANLRR